MAISKSIRPDLTDMGPMVESKRFSPTSWRTGLGWAATAAFALGLVLGAACGSSNVPDPASPAAEADAAPADGQPTFTPRINDVPPEEVQALLSGDVLERFQALPEDYKRALAAYMAFGVSPDLLPTVVEHKIGQWPESPAPLPELLGPDGYETFKGLGSSKTTAPYYAYVLLTFYVHVLNEEDTPEGQAQALRLLVDSYGGSTPEKERAPELWVSRPPLDGILTPAALTGLGQLGPSFQQALREPLDDEMHIRTLAIAFTLYEVLLLKTPAGTELPSIQAHLSEQRLVDLVALPVAIRSTVEPRFHQSVLRSFALRAIYPSAMETTMPPKDLLSRMAEGSLAMGEVRAKAGAKARTAAAAPPADDTDLLDIMDAETTGIYGELSACAQNVMVLLFDRMRAEGAPPETWAGHMAEAVRGAYETEYGKYGRQEGEIPEVSDC